MSATLKAIDTRYAGHLFRSRLEARWAVFFDRLGLRWEYEPEGFVLPDGTRYLPDFRLHTPQGERRWVEVKPSHITSDPKFEAFDKALPLNVDASDTTGAALVSGSPLEWLRGGHSFCPRCGMPNSDSFDDFGGIGYALLCYPCDWETPGGGGHDPEPTGVGGIEWLPHKGWICLPYGQAPRWGRAAGAAAVAAQEARFEHGATT